MEEEGGGGGGRGFGDEPPELRDDFEERFADELEALAEMEGDSPWAAPTHKVSEFRSRKRTFEEVLCAGDLVKEPGVGGGRLCPKRGSQDLARLKDITDDEGPERLSSLMEALEDHPSGQKPDSGLAHTPKPKRHRGLEAVKKLDFRTENRPELEEGPDWQGGITPPLSPKARSGSPDARPPGLKDLDCTGLEELLPLPRSPPAEREPKKVRKRPPVLEDYINVTSTSGSRVFMVVKEDGASAEVATSVGRNWQRPLHLLGVPFSYLKEQVAEECRKQVLDSSHRLTEVLNSCLSEDDPQTVAPVEGEEGGGGAGEDGSAPHALWVDQFAPCRYVELLSDDYTNRCLLKWLKSWDTVVFGKERPSREARPSVEARPPFRSAKEPQGKWKDKAQLTEDALEAELDQHNRPKFKVALLCGPPGLGKTTLALVIARHAGYNAVEMNASQSKSRSAFGNEESSPCLFAYQGI
ncbi:hypothetical protein JRQ81_010474 [Phrynocephalus forsythii]|uniref:ATPase AAA-type core domain-containing protein n=1 Tax=Phrynocephalus forsythii TaxID=171643 RepID=A0A9Q0X8Z8_9SAUR|nr:hypothetical protein JRQ81_010474 [Phrynocephalus forsythii]